MTLGEKISVLRTAQKLSQGNLAEKLGVSRQSISKWETDQSIPELDKLIQLSDLFQISLDDLVRGGEIPEPPKEVSQPEKQLQLSPTVTAERIVGCILLALGVLVCLFALLAGSGFLLLGGYLILCAVLCFVIKHNALLTSAWITTLIVMVLMPCFTGVRMFAVFNPGFYRYGFGINQIISIVSWLVVAFLIYRTVKVCRERK